MHRIESNYTRFISKLNFDISSAYLRLRWIIVRVFLTLFNNENAIIVTASATTDKESPDLVNVVLIIRPKIWLTLNFFLKLKNELLRKIVICQFPKVRVFSNWIFFFIVRFSWLKANRCCGKIHFFILTQKIDPIVYCE